MRLRYLSAAVLVTACGAGHLKREVVGVGAGTVQVRGTVDAGAAAAVAPAGGITLAPGNYELKLRFDVPRAQVVEWTVTCPGFERNGSVGETFDAYRERRLAQLRAQRERDRQNTAAVTGALIGAVAPDVHARGQASGPNGQATVDATVSGEAVGATAGTAIADATASPIVVELPPGDVGAGRLERMIHVAIAEPGACAVNAVADDANVLAGFDIVHVRDLRAEARERSIAANKSAHEVRGQLSAQLVAYGADVTLRQRRAEEAARLRAERQAKIDAEMRIRAEAEARARAERQAKLDAEASIRAEAEARLRAERQVKIDAEMRIRAEAEAKARAERQAKIDAELRIQAEVRAKAELEARAKLEIEVRLRNEALRTRGELFAYLVGTCNADPHRRERLREEREARLRVEREQREVRLRIELEQREARLRAEREQRLAIEAERQARLRAKEQQRLAIEAERARRVEIALTVRADLRAYLVSLGARERPPMPAPLPEVPGNAPFDGAVWVAGAWRWTGGQWIWEAGGWRDETVFGASGSIGGVISVGKSIGTSISTGVSTSTHVEPQVEVRDHRTTTTSTSTTSTPTVRDHRTEPATTSTPTVRDHRNESTPKPSTPTVRDHRKDDEDDKKKDNGPKVRDHRR